MINDKMKPHKIFVQCSDFFHTAAINPEENGLFAKITGMLLSVSKKNVI